MAINWFTFVAQIVNFLILLVLLRRFLYGPILSVMAKREAQIAARFQEAEKLAAEAQAEADAYRAQREEIAARRDALLREASQAAEQRRADMLDAARAEVDELQASWYAAVEQEKERFLQEVRARMGESVYRVARDALIDLASADLEDAIAAKFLKKVRARDGSEPNSDGLTSEPDDVVIVRSAFELSPEVQSKIRAALTNSSAPPGAGDGDPLHTSVAFTLAPDLICGIEAQFGSRRVAWNIRDYLASYAEQLDATLVAELNTRAEPVDIDAQRAAPGGILPG